MNNEIDFISINSYMDWLSNETIYTENKGTAVMKLFQSIDESNVVEDSNTQS